MLNRSVAPDFKPIKDLTLIEPEVLSFDNGLKAFVFREPNLELIKLEFVFNNIFVDETLPLLNSTLATLLKEGTAQLSSAEIAEKIDFYGAYLMPEYSFDHTSLTVYTMHKYVDNILPIISDILNNSTFPQHELETYIQNNKQSLQISLKKNDVIARRLFYQHVFGENRYGAVPSAEAYDSIKREALQNLFLKQIRPDNCTLFIAGNVDKPILEAIKRSFGENWGDRPDSSPIGSFILPNVTGHFLLENKEEALQSAIRMGKLTINRTHADFPALQFVNTLLGGFFGSRLMRNIREDKGYTYSIGSAVASVKHTGFFTLASEVGVDVTKNTLEEIQKEFDKLRQEKTKADEVDLVRNYLQGVMLGSLESVFSHVDKFKGVYFYDMDLSYYTYYGDIIANMTSSHVQDIAIRYFDFSDLTQIVVGKNNS